MDRLYWESIKKSVLGLVAFIALFFIPAGTWDYWQGWLFIAVFTVCTTALTIYLALYDKAALERRLHAGPSHEKERTQKIIMSFAFVAFILYMVLPPIDHRLGLSPVGAWVSVAGNALIVLSFLFIFWVMRTNSFAAANITVEGDQKVIDTGPYALVRHPMYAGALLMFLCIPLALGSWWPIALNVLFVPILIWRLVDEERILHRDLPGYTEYTQRVKYRLIPYLW